MRRFLIVLLVMMLGLVSCVKEVEFNGEQSDPLLVVNGIQQVGQPARLNVEKSLFFLDTSKDFRVKDVAVDLYVNGVFKESLQVRDSLITVTYLDWNDEEEEILVEQLVYAFNYCEGQYILCAGDQLRFEVRSSEFDEMGIVETKMPEMPKVISFDTVRIDYHKDSEQYECLFSLKLDDPSGKDYYNIYPLDGMVGFTSSDPVFADLMNFDVENLVGESTSFYGYGTYNIFSDAYFDGKTYSVSMSVTIWEGDFEEGMPFTLEVSCVDGDLYQFKKTYDAYVASDPNSMLGMFTEPVQVYSNVQNGMGIVAAQSQPVVLTIDLTSNF